MPHQSEFVDQDAVRETVRVQMVESAAELLARAPMADDAERMSALAVMATVLFPDGRDLLIEISGQNLPG